MRRPGIKPGSTAWKADHYTTNAVADGSEQKEIYSQTKQRRVYEENLLDLSIINLLPTTVLTEIFNRYYYTRFFFYHFSDNIKT